MKTFRQNRRDALNGVSSSLPLRSEHSETHIYGVAEQQTACWKYAQPPVTVSIPFCTLVYNSNTADPVA